MVIARFSFNVVLNLFGPQGLGLLPTLPLLGLMAAFCLTTVYKQTDSLSGYPKRVCC